MNNMKPAMCPDHGRVFVDDNHCPICDKQTKALKIKKLPKKEQAAA